MRFSVYADLSRPLTSDEQSLVFAALDVLVPDSGCIGPSRSGDYEVFFTVDAATREAAQKEAAGYLDAILHRAGVTVSYLLTLQPQVTSA